MCQMSGKEGKWGHILHEFDVEQCINDTHVLASKF